MVERIRVRNVGPVKKADIRFGDLTVFVGPQATGKSIVLQLLKLLLDKRAIHATMRRYGLAWRGDLDAFLDLYLGEGMASIWKPKSKLTVDGNEVDFENYTKRDRSSNSEIMFYIPAQRVMSLRDGMTRPFSDYRAGDPFVLREFSEKLHGIVQNTIGMDEEVFPRQQFFNAPLRKPIEDHIFGGSELHTDTAGHRNRLVLKKKSVQPLSYLAWSAGQREFTPLLLGLYWLMPAASISRRKNGRGRFLEWAVIEEPEMGLHPNATGAVLNLVMELLRRGYRVCLSTHSPHVLDIVWALRFIQDNDGDTDDILKLLRLPHHPILIRQNDDPKKKNLPQAARDSNLKTYYFTRDGKVHDISGLDPGSDDRGEWGWGGLTEFSSHVGKVVANVAGRAEEERL